MTDTSLSLLDRARSPDNGSSWGQLAAVYMPVLHAWLRRYEIQAADADDLVQDVLVVVSRELCQFEHNGRPGAFRGWLRMILVHRLRDFWRRRQYRPVASGGSDFVRQLDQLEDPHSELSEQWNREHDRHLLLGLLRQIETRFQEPTRLAFRRIVIDGAEPGQAAEELGLTLNAVLIAKSRVLKELRREGSGLLS